METPTLLRSRNGNHGLLRQSMARKGSRAKTAPKSSQRISQVMGLGSLGFGLAQVLFPAKASARWGSTPRTIRALGVRDLAIGSALVLEPASAAPLVARAVSDASDTVTFRGNRAVMLFAAGAALTALVGLLLRRG